MLNFRKSPVRLRRDLRNFDHAALYHALKQAETVFILFIFDKEILQGPPSNDRRVEFIHGCGAELDRELRYLGSGLIVSYAIASSDADRPARGARRASLARYAVKEPGTPADDDE